MKDWLAYLLLIGYPLAALVSSSLPFCQLCGKRIPPGENARPWNPRTFPPYNRHQACHIAFEAHPRLQTWHRIRIGLVVTMLAMIMAAGVAGMFNRVDLMYAAAIGMIAAASGYLVLSHGLVWYYRFRLRSRTK